MLAQLFASTSVHAQDVDSLVRLIATSSYQRPHGLIDPDNSLLQLPWWTAGVELRPDFAVRAAQWELIAKPRLRGSWDYASRAGDHHRFSRDAYARQLTLRVMPISRLSFSFGIENLQWGPALAYSPSNPFFHALLANDPFREEPGSYLARAVWTLSSALSASVITDLWDAGQGRYPSFQRRAALKLDYVASRLQLSTIVSYATASNYALGGYAVWTASDALLFYTENGWQSDNPALFPATDASALGYHLAGRAHDRAFTALVGTAYTFTIGLTLAAEYLYASGGYDHLEARALDTLRDQANAARRDAGALAPSATQLLLASIEPAGRLLRRNYALVQARFMWGDEADAEVSCTWLQSLDEPTTSVSSHALVPLSDGVDLLLLVLVNHGPRPVVAYQALAGFGVFLS
jgi:hypothetical protein